MYVYYAHGRGPSDAEYMILLTFTVTSSNLQEKNRGIWNVLLSEKDGKDKLDW